MDRVGVFGRRFVGDIPSTLLSILYYGRTESDRHLLCCARVPWLEGGGLTDLPVAACNNKIKIGLEGKARP